MKTLTVDLGERSYDIRIGCGVSVGDALDPNRTTRALVVSDTNVAPLHAERIEAQLGARGLEVSRVAVPAGEASKSLTCLSSLFDAALDSGLDRSSVIVALGGGVVGDLAGFAAATYLRGVRLIQVPTSLLAMVDSSVGGKTGVNVPRGKNLVGAFYQPIEVAVDLATLQTLPEREYLSGLAEVVKYGVIWDPELFALLEENAEAVLERDNALLAELVARSCAIKADVVAQDERESGLRSILNFGHTLGHALENTAGYGTYLHGEAVSLGMVYAAELSKDVRGMTGDDRDRIVALLERFRLPVCLAKGAVGVQNADWDAVRASMASDKKSLSSVPRFVLAERIGNVSFGCEVAESVLAFAFERLRRM